MNRSKQISAMRIAVLICSVAAGTASAVDLAEVEVIGVLTIPDVGTVHADPNPNIDPEVTPGNGNPVQAVTDLVACTPYLTAFISNPEFLQPLVDYIGCTTGAIPLALLPGVSGLPPKPVVGGIKNDILSGELNYTSEYVSGLVTVSEDVSQKAPQAHKVVFSCLFSLGASSSSVNPTVATISYFGKSSCGNLAPLTRGTNFDFFEYIGSDAASITGQAKVFNIVSGAILATGNSFSVTQEGISQGSLHSPITTVKKVKFSTSATVSFPPCASGNCAVKWIIVPNKSVSTSTQLSCTGAGNSIACEIDSPPFITGLGPSTTNACQPPIPGAVTQIVCN